MKEWTKRLLVLAVTALWAILVRELIPHLNLSKWSVTGASVTIYILAFMLADLAGRPWTKK